MCRRATSTRPWASRSSSSRSTWRTAGGRSRCICASPTRRKAMAMPGEPRRNFYAGATVDRLSHLRRDAEWIARRLAEPTTRILPVWRLQNLVIPGNAPQAAWLSPERATALLAEVREIAFLGDRESVAHFAVEVSY